MKDYIQIGIDKGLTRNQEQEQENQQIGAVG